MASGRRPTDRTRFGAPQCQSGEVSATQAVGPTDSFIEIESSVGVNSLQKRLVEALSRRPGEILTAPVGMEGQRRDSGALRRQREIGGVCHLGVSRATDLISSPTIATFTRRSSFDGIWSSAVHTRIIERITRHGPACRMTSSVRPEEGQFGLAARV
jgi:hypothetical protein